MATEGPATTHRLATHRSVPIFASVPIRWRVQPHGEPLPYDSTHDPSLRARIRRALERFIRHPITDIGVVVVIIVAVGSLLGEAVYLRGSKERVLLHFIGDLCSLLWALELTIRFIVARSKRRFFQRYWVDLLAVLPLARPLRLLRVLVLLRLFRAGMLMNRRLTSYSGVLRGTYNEITVVGTLTVTLVLVGAMVLHLGGGGVELQNQDMHGTLEGNIWFAFMTLIAGEPILGQPNTQMGITVTAALMLGGMAVMGIFIGTVSASMTAVLNRRLQVSELELSELSDHVVVCGWNPAGPTMLGELFAKGATRRPVVVITEVEERPADLLLPDVPAELIYHLSGDYTRVDILEAVSIRRASAAILLTDTLTPRADQDRDARTVLAALTIEQMSPGIFCCAELINGQHESLLKMAKVEEVVVRDWYAGVIIGSMGRNRGMSRVLNDILSTTEGNAFHKVRVGPGFAGQTIGQLHGVLKEQQNAILVSWEQDDDLGRRTDIKVNPPPDMVVMEGDLLVVISDHIVALH